jgi:hypothetical protein
VVTLPAVPLLLLLLLLLVPLLALLLLVPALALLLAVAPVFDAELETLVVGAALLDATVAERLLSAGSLPLISTIAITSQAATNSATAPEITRRRRLRARPARASRATRARSRAASLSAERRGSRART